MKRTTLLLIGTCFGLLLMFTAQRAGAVQVYIPPLTVTAGQTVRIPVKVDQVDNLAGFKMVLHYDPQLLKYKGTAKTSHTAPLMHIVNDRKPGVLIVVMAGARGIQGRDMVLFTMTFEVSESVSVQTRTRLEITEVQLMSDTLKELKGDVQVDPLVIEPNPDKPEPNRN